MEMWYWRRIDNSSSRNTVNKWITQCKIFVHRFIANDILSEDKSEKKLFLQKSKAEI